VTEHRAQFDPRIECSWTIDSSYYIDPARLEEEKHKIFSRTWQLAGRTENVASPGSYFTADVFGEPVLVVRDKQGALRAFHNVCRHRAGPVAQGCGRRDVFQCGYHGWTYTLDGRLIGTPEVDGVEFFDRSTMGLHPIRVEMWEQFVFVNLDATAPPLAKFLGEIPGSETRGPIREMRFVERRDYLVECNWKVYVDNYLEGYHIPIAHPTLMREIEYGEYRTITRRFSSWQHAPLRRDGRDSAARTYAKGEGSDDAVYLWVFPNLMLNLYPGNLQTNLIIPVSHDRTLTVFEWFFAGEDSAAQRETIRRVIELGEVTQKEDVHLCETVQRGLRSRSYSRGRYSVRREQGVHHFHSLLLEFLEGEKKQGAAG
jgi:choline monooxygenase